MRVGKHMKGKGQVAKRAKDDDQERLIRDRARAMELAERNRILIKQKLQHLQNLRKEEEKLTTMNRGKLMSFWLKIMREVKTVQLKKDVEVLSQNHERDMDRKDAILQMLDRDLDEAEEQYQMAQRSYMLHVDQLLELQETRLEALHRSFDTDVETLSTEFKLEKEEITAQHATERKELLDIIAAVEKEERDFQENAEDEHKQVTDEVTNKTHEDINYLKNDLFNQMEELERHFDSQHQNFRQNTDQRTKDYKHLLEQDQMCAREIERKYKLIERYTNSIAQWKTKIQQTVVESEERNVALKAEKEQIAKHFQDLKTRMNRFREDECRRLTDLTVNSRECAKKLNAHLTIAQKILKTAEMCRKLETEKEKILPFYDTSRFSLDDIQLEASLKQELEEHRRSMFLENGRPAEDWVLLESFFKRLNKVSLDKLAIQKEKDRLNQENQDLRLILKQYLDGISVNNNVMNSLNPLMVVNGRVNLNRPPVRRMDVPSVIVEGNHTQAVRSPPVMMYANF